MKRTNALRNLSLSLLLAASVFAAPAYAAVNLSINIGPPAPQYEVVPIMQPGYVWIRGRSIAQREGYRWEPDRWEQHDRGYVRTAGHWEHDRGYKSVKMKNEKHHGDHDNGNHGNGNHGH